MGSVICTGRSARQLQNFMAHRPAMASPVFRAWCNITTSAAPPHPTSVQSTKPRPHLLMCVAALPCLLWTTVQRCTSATVLQLACTAWLHAVAEGAEGQQVTCRSGPRSADHGHCNSPPCRVGRQSQAGWLPTLAQGAHTQQATPKGVAEQPKQHVTGANSALIDCASTSVCQLACHTSKAHTNDHPTAEVGHMYMALQVQLQIWRLPAPAGLPQSVPMESCIPSCTRGLHPSTFVCHTHSMMVPSPTCSA